jgi:hypothetical protein
MHRPDLVVVISFWLNHPIARRFCCISLMLISLYSDNAFAGTKCSGVLNDGQRDGVQKMFTPEYSPRLTQVKVGVTESSFSKKLNQDDLKKLHVPLPILVARYTLNADRASFLKNELNKNASAELPGWIATTTTVAVPAAWAGLTADVFIQLINNADSPRRLKVANLAGTVSRGGLLAVTEQVANDVSGRPMFLWAYVYQAKLNDETIIAPLAVCSADVVLE